MSEVEGESVGSFEYITQIFITCSEVGYTYIR